MRYFKFAVMRYLVLLVWMPCINMAMAQEAKEPTKLLLKIEAVAATNPDDSGRPSPIKVRLYELKDSNSFGEADYFGLNSADKSILGADLLSKDEFILRPGESKTIERASHNQTTALGILAGYRDLANSTWRVADGYRAWFADYVDTKFRGATKEYFCPEKPAVISADLTKILVAIGGKEIPDVKTP